MPTVSIPPAPAQEQHEFWMCYVPSGGIPTVAHETKELAITEASRLARLTKKRVFILHSLGFVEVERQEPPVTFTEF